MTSLMGPAELRRRLTESRGKALALSMASSFPEPVARLAQGRVWLTEDIEDWISRHQPHLATSVPDD